jgi:hypothetical protein
VDGTTIQVPDAEDEQAIVVPPGVGSGGKRVHPLPYIESNLPGKFFQVLRTAKLQFYLVVSRSLLLPPVYFVCSHSRFRSSRQKQNLSGGLTGLFYIISDSSLLWVVFAHLIGS